MNTIVTCVYCGHEYPEGTPTAKQGLLTEHIQTCHAHPMRAAEEKIYTLKSALSGLIGASKKEELDSMEIAIRSQAAPMSDKAVIIDAIDALRSCI